MAFNPDAGTVVGGFDPDAGVVIAPKQTKVKPVTAKAPAIDSTIQRDAPGRFSGEARVTASPSWRETAMDAQNTLFPTVAEHGAAPWPLTRDLLTMVPRIAGATGAALGTGFGEGSLPAAAQTFRDFMRDPQGEVAQSDGGLVQQIAAGSADDPTLIPSVYFGGGGKTLLSAVLRGAPIGAATYGSHALDRATAGSDTPFSGESTGQMLADVAPVAIPLAFKAAQPMVYLLKGGAAKLLTSAGKAQITAKAPDIIERGEGWLKGGGIPQVVKNTTMLPEGVGMNFLKLLKSARQGYPAAKAAADATGIKVPTNEAVQAAEDFARAQIDKGDLTLSDRGLANSVKWLKDHITVPDSPEGRALQEAARNPPPKPMIINPATGRTFLSEPMIADPEIMIRQSTAQGRKQALQSMARKPEASAIAPINGRIAVAKGASDYLVKQQKANAPMLYELNKKMAPMMDVKDYFSYFPRRATTNFMSFGTPWRVGQTMGARQLWNVAQAIDQEASKASSPLLARAFSELAQKSPPKGKK
jgi:hypothetical protein